MPKLNKSRHEAKAQCLFLYPILKQITTIVKMWRGSGETHVKKSLVVKEGEVWKENFCQIWDWKKK